MKREQVLTSLLVLGPLCQVASARAFRTIPSYGPLATGCHSETQKKGRPLAELVDKGLPQSIVSIDLDIYHHGCAEAARLAVLRSDGLHIYQPEGQTLVQDFFLPEPKGAPWDTMQSFPSQNHLFGVVLWVSEGSSYAAATVVCYVRGQFEVVFRGHDVDFVDLDLDGVPEIITEETFGETDQPPQWGSVWTWNGRKYEKVKRIRLRELYSQEVVEAVRRTKRGQVR